MASSASRSEIFAATPGSLATIALSPNSGSGRVLKTPSSDQVIWKRLREAGFDEESIKRRDKASLIAYIAKLEAEMYEHQHQMGLLIMEKKDWMSKYEEAKAVADSTELNFKRVRLSHASDLADAKKREDSLKKAIAIERECVKNIEKSLHEMRAEYAELKVAADTKFVEAKNMMDNALKNLTEADERKRGAELLEAEANRYHRTAERKLHEVEEREDDLRRRILSSKADFEAKEKEIERERQSLSERQEILQHTEDRLLDGQALLNQREEYVFSKTQELKRYEKELEDLRLQIDKERTAVNEEKVALELKASSLSAREEDVNKREYDLLKKEEAAILLQAKISTIESDKAQQLMSNHEAALAMKNSIFEADAEIKRKLLDDEINAKRRVWELRELEIRQQEDTISEKERELDIKSRRLEKNINEVEARFNLAEEREKTLLVTEEKLESLEKSLDQEKEELVQMKLDLEKLSDFLEEKRRRISDAEEKTEATRKETNELMALESRLKEEIDIICAQKRELEAEADRLKAEKAKFESEWELIDVKREELLKEAERIAEERSAVSKFLKDERESLKAERDSMREQYKSDLESLSRDREAFVSEHVRERTEWFDKIQKEHAEFLLDIEMQKKEVDYRIESRREEIGNYLKEREKEFEEEKVQELRHIASLRERVEKEMEHVNFEMKKLDTERREINLDREKRDQEWSELNNSIVELKVQREKLEKQRELLRGDREEILARIETLKNLEGLKERLDSSAIHEMHQFQLQSNNRKLSSKSFGSRTKLAASDRNGNFNEHTHGVRESDKSSSPFSWLKRCADTLLDPRQSSKKMRKEKDVTMCRPGDTTPRTQQKSDIEQFVQAPEGAERTVYIDKIITVQEVTTVNTERVVEDSKEAAFRDDVENDEVEFEINGKL